MGSGGRPAYQVVRLRRKNARVAPPESARPTTWGECQALGLPEGCPYVSCRYNLSLEVMPKGTLAAEGLATWDVRRYLGKDRLEKRLDAFADLVVKRIESGKPTCALERAAEGPLRLSDVGDLMGRLSKERVRQLEARILEDLRYDELLHGQWGGEAPRPRQTRERVMVPSLILRRLL